MPSPRSKPQYIVVEYETQPSHDSLVAAVSEATLAHEQDRSKGYAVVELIAIISSEHKTLVTRLK